MTDASPSRLRSTLWIVLSYAVALFAGMCTIALMGESHPLLEALAADIVATLVIFGFAIPFRNSSFYDAYWSVAPIPIVVWWIGFAPDGATIRQFLVFGLIALWGCRLTWNWWRGWSGLDHEDWRYVDLREQTGLAWPVVNLTGIMLFPTLLVFAGMLPVFFAVTAARPFHWLDCIGVAVALVGIGFEWLGDRQLRAFRDASPPRDAVLDTGLWSWSRHPNYFGEMTFWWGLGLIGVSAVPSAWWTLIGAAGMVALFQFISIPMIEKRMLARRPAYADVQKRVSKLIPMPPRER